MLRQARPWWPSVPDEAGSAAVLLWRTRRTLARHGIVVGLLLAAVPLVATVALWPRRSARPARCRAPHSPSRLARAAIPSWRRPMAGCGPWIPPAPARSARSPANPSPWPPIPLPPRST